MMKDKIVSVFKQALMERCPPYFLIACVCVIILVAVFEWMFPIFATLVVTRFMELYPFLDWDFSHNPMLVLSTQLLYWLDKLTITLLGYTILSFTIDYLYPLALKRYHEFTKPPA